MADEYAPFGIAPAFDPMTGAQIGGDLGRTEPEAYPNKFARALIQVISNMPKHTLVDAPSALVESSRRAPLPGAERTPENEAATQDLAGQSFMTALGLAGQSMPFAPHASAGIFGGRLAKTADQTALRTAEEMHAGGADRAAIWDKTGWFQGSDGKWRFEIPDDKAQMNPNIYAAGIPPGRWGKIAGEVWHKDLYDAYPDLRNATGMIEGRTPGSSAGGSYSAPGVARSGEETIHVQSPTVDDARSVSLHELQHAVQEREGFASGGNPAMFKQGDDAILSRDALSYRRELEGLDPSLTPKQKDEIVRQRYRALDMEDMIPPQAARDVAHDVEGNPERTLRRVMELYGTDKRIEPHSPRDLYRQVPGEIEARNVQARRDMTPDQRRATPPWSTADAPGSPILNEMFGRRVGLLEGGQASKSIQASIQEPGGIRAYHGSPHDFDKFDTSRIGSGEGAQAYGHGLYFAEREPVAQQYRDQLRWKGADYSDPQVVARNALDRLGDRKAAADSLESAMEATNRFHRGKPPAAQASANETSRRAIDILRGGHEITGAPPTSGHMYEVNIGANPEHFLDLDASLSAQSPHVREALERSGFVLPESLRNPSITGSRAHQMAVSDIGAPAAAKELLDAGVPGLSYLDQHSRLGGGTKNYVVFDDAVVKILRKYGLAGVGPAGVGALAAAGGAGDDR